jgi:hypothetical protein
MDRLNRICEWLGNNGFVGVLLMIGFCVGVIVAIHAYMSRQVIHDNDKTKEWFV